MPFRRWGPRLAAFCLVVVAAIGGLPGIAAAQTELSVDAGYGGYGQSGRSFPLRIEVTSDVLFAGELRISSRGSGLAIARQIEIPGGTTREFTVVWEWSLWRVGTITVQLVADGEIAASTTVRPVELQNTDLVGIFPALADRGIPDKAPLLFDAGEALLFPVDPASLAAGWAVLEPLDMVVVTAADLRGLDTAGLDALLGWVNRGGRLLVDEPAGAEIPGVPAEWQPDGAQPRLAGQGEIMVTDGVAASGHWEAIFEPAPTRSRQQDGALGELHPFWGGEPVSWSLGRDAGLSLPRARWLAAIVGAYVVVAGVGVWLASRMLRRPGLSWILVPATAVVFAAGIWVLGSSLRNSAKTAHGTIVEVAPRGTVATTYSLLHSGGHDRDSVSLPPGWSTIPVVSERRPSVVDIVHHAAGSTASIELDAGAFTVLGGSGTHAAFDGALEVTAWSVRDDRIAGTVVNNLGVDLHEVVVLADQAGANIGTVPAGATVEFDDVGEAINPFDEEPVEFRVWRDALRPELTGDFGRDHDPGPVNLGLWNELSARWSLNARKPGQVVVAAWSDELPSPLDAEVTAGRTLFVARGAIESRGGSLAGVAVTRESVRGLEDLGLQFRIDGWGGGAMFRFVLPESADTGDPVLSVPRSQDRLELWTGTQWRLVDLEPNTRAVFELPAGSTDRGRVYAKVLFDFERGFPSLQDLAVRSLRSDDELLTLSYAADDESSRQQTRSDSAGSQRTRIAQVEVAG